MLIEPDLELVSCDLDNITDAFYVFIECVAKTNPKFLPIFLATA